MQPFVPNIYAATKFNIQYGATYCAKYQYGIANIPNILWWLDYKFIVQISEVVQLLFINAVQGVVPIVFNVQL